MALLLLLLPSPTRALDRLRLRGFVSTPAKGESDAGARAVACALPRASGERPRLFERLTRRWLAAAAPTLRRCRDEAWLRLRDRSPCSTSCTAAEGG